MYSVNKLTVLYKTQKIINLRNHIVRIFEYGKNPIIFVKFICFKSLKKVIYSCIVIYTLSFGQVKAESSKFIFIDIRHIPYSSTAVFEEFIQFQKQRVSNSVEFFAFISSSSEVMTEPSTQEKRKYSPKESNKAEAGLEEQDEITQEDIEHFKSSIIGMLLISLVMIPLGIILGSYISPRILAKRKRWMKLHTLKAKRFHRNNPNKHYTTPRKTLCQWLWF
ncbi:hypothetical protein CO695_17775 [Providencia alcalifaciens]|uniref:Uncharacterized protein n=1 Tax=Providencia alcalifaciens DSM 30120 TaxID=520999 RepID=B6XBP4_9GAMM|nr:hypothetical protein [Providencia alcalifaciens]ATG18060.1 hypothetical protein CO695_17775 [Providencia alcalifaciens]EEB47046.1 hypothetical protein PROVALCAL_00755 [Providencia alcalifaciens DSM 30120]SQI33474.1 Uncharacterised protein [Providencia alcalifaciens]